MRKAVLIPTLLLAIQGWGQVKIESAARGGLLRLYSPKSVSETSFANSERIYSLVKAGQVYCRSTMRWLWRSKTTSTLNCSAMVRPSR
jgi:hypothetical protein